MKKPLVPGEGSSRGERADETWLLGLSRRAQEVLREGSSARCAHYALDPAMSCVEPDVSGNGTSGSTTVVRPGARGTEDGRCPSPCPVLPGNAVGPEPWDQAPWTHDHHDRANDSRPHHRHEGPRRVRQEHPAPGHRRRPHRGEVRLDRARDDRRRGADRPGAEVKKRRESAQIYTDAGATERADNETHEADFIEKYLPASLTPAELDALVAAAVVSTGASSMKDMGTVMKTATAAAAGIGRVDGKALSQAVRQALGAL